MILLQDPVSNEILIQTFQDLGANGVLLLAVWWMIKCQDRRSEKQDERWDAQLKASVAMEKALVDISSGVAKMQETQLQTTGVLARIVERMDRMETKT